ncbi:FAD-dependent oxidoreductase [Longibacter salinarum]|uniref:FAD-dependent oxidoreductase n=1 Tax=Longibacter salinarum TaxID=1850348 RepID=A0A2A8D233_9BACT|nr:glycerol-3-phosphate dehydrogenase/oxidase [Longibacter salinarum]PEN15032.1 FAD-dependent oxidoreductase [Longibacter salinarum]
MQRDTGIRALEDHEGAFDFIVVGGGATGLGVAIEAASRGYDTLLLEMHDFAKATSSRSTKLVHGGVRYLQQGNISLVLEALKERGLLQENAPHLVHNLAFVVPNYDWWEGPFYGIGMKVYDMLAGRQNFGRSKHLSREETLKHLPTIEPKGLRGGVIYYDGQFDDARLAVNMAQTVVEQGGIALNYVKVTDLIKSDEGVVNGVVAVDQENDKEYRLHAKAVINATGIFTDSIRKMDDPNVRDTLRPSQGVHIVLDKSFLPGDSAIMVPKTDDGRVLFAIPWLNRIVVGTTDTEVDGPTMEPVPMQEELDFLIEHAGRYLVKDPTPDDVLSAFAGIRPLVTRPDAPAGDTSDISREHVLHISNNGLVTISGGKWTTYRKMAEDTIDQAATLADVDERPSVTKNLHIHGWHEHPEQFGDLSQYGSDAPGLKGLMRDRPELSEKLDKRLPIRKAMVVWGTRHEMARQVEDILARRTRSLLLNAKAAVDIAPEVAQLMAEELDHSQDWVDEQVNAFTELAQSYILTSETTQVKSTT